MVSVIFFSPIAIYPSYFHTFRNYRVTTNAVFKAWCCLFNCSMEFSPATMNMLCGVIETTSVLLLALHFCSVQPHSLYNRCFLQVSFSMFSRKDFSNFCLRLLGTSGHLPLEATKVWTVVLTFLPVVQGQCWKTYLRFSMARINHLKMQSRSFLLWDVWFSLKSNSVIPLSQWPIWCTLGLVKALIQNPWYT